MTATTQASKACTECGAEKPLAQFHRNSRSADGHTWKCKACAITYARRNAKELRERPVTPPTSGMKTCSACAESLSTSEFYKRSIALDGLNSKCKVCARAHRAAYVKANPEKIAKDREKLRQAYAADPEKWARHLLDVKEWREANRQSVLDYARTYAQENSERVAANKRLYYLANLERLRAIRAAQPERNREISARHRERNRDVIAERQRRRRVDKLGLKVEDVDVESLWTGLCGLCGQSMDRDLHHPDPMSKSIDHKIPLALGGNHEESNLHWAHLRCNLAKGANPLADLTFPL